MQVSLLTGGWVERGVLVETANHALTSAVSLVPFVALVLLRTCESTFEGSASWRQTHVPKFTPVLDIPPLSRDRAIA